MDEVKPAIHILSPAIDSPTRLRGMIVLTIGLLLGACASGPPPPDWMRDSSIQFPAERYVVGIASHPETDQADRMALAQIGEQTSGEMEGARLADAWYDERDRLHWSLAVLDRELILGKLRAEQAAIDARVQAALRVAELDTPVRALPLLVDAATSVPARDQLSIRVANLGGSESAEDQRAREHAKQLSETLERIKSQLRIAVSSWEIDARTGAIGDVLDQNERALTQTVLALGFAPGSSDRGWGTESNWLRVESKVALERLQLHPSDSMVAVRWDAAIEITDVAAGGDVIAILTDEGRAVHLSEIEARRQADSAARDFATSALEKWLVAQTTGTNRSQ